MKKKLTAVFLSICMAVVFLLSPQAAGLAADNGETLIQLSDNGIRVNGSNISEDPDAAVYAGADIVYYEAGHDSTYGEGTAADEHLADEALQHTVVTITQPGTYRISGTLSAGQIAVDLGSDAAEDQSAVVQLILDGVDITCTVGPAVIFYNVWESGSSEETGAIVTLADDSVNTVNGSYVARIYKEGTTKKLHKYDGAFYSKMSMLIQAETAGTGQLIINAENEGLDSEMHLTINGGNFQIRSQDDAINANEDGVSVITLNGGYLYIDAGNGTEGDGIDSNGYLYINGGTLVSLANGRSGDGGIDADLDIMINGGTVIALGSRNDSSSTNSAQPYMELSYAATKAANTIIRITDSQDNEILTFKPAKLYQSLTYSSPSLALDTVYHVYSGGTITGAAETDGLYTAGGVYSDGTQQQYSGNSAFGMAPGGMPPDDRFAEIQPPDNLDEWLSSSNLPDDIRAWIVNASSIFSQNNETQGVIGERSNMTNLISIPETMEEWMESSEIPDEIKSWLESVSDMLARVPGDEGMMGERPDMTAPPEMGDDMIAPPDRPDMGTMLPGDNVSDGTASAGFIITADQHSFGNVTNYTQDSDKTVISFKVNEDNKIQDAAYGTAVTVKYAGAAARNGDAVNIAASDVQFTITDVPSENYSASCMLSDGADALADIIPSDEGTYTLTIAVVDSNTEYTGSSQWEFTIHEEGYYVWPFNDVAESDSENWYYSSVKYSYDNSLMNGVSNTAFEPQSTVNRAMFVTILGRMAGAEVKQNAACGFNDIVKDGWSAGYISWAAENGIMAGYSADTFGQYDEITREQMCLILVNYARYAGIELTASIDPVTFSDSSDISSWAAEAVSICQQAGLVEGVGGNHFDPQTSLTRGEAAAIFMRFAQNYIN